jgi:hypothetical protein
MDINVSEMEPHSDRIRRALKEAEEETTILCLQPLILYRHTSASHW